jgi:hypothetical protein
MTTRQPYYRFRPNIIAAMRPQTDNLFATAAAVKERFWEVVFEYERLAAARVDNSTPSDP